MFLKTLFAKPDILLKVKIITNDSSYLEILEKSREIEEKELILMGLLIYARVLKIEKSETEKNLMVSNFLDYYKIYLNEDNSINYDKVIEHLTSKSNESNYIAIKRDFKTIVKLKKYKNSEYFLHMGLILANPTSSVVYTTFIYIWNNVNQKNKIYLFNSFIFLSNFYKLEKFTSNTAVSIPNKIINEITEFK